ncbi:MAG: UbiA family prenyltransferase [Marmoricola sp.]
MILTKARKAPAHAKPLLRAVHPRQALAAALVVGALVALMGRPLREIGISAAAVLVAQMLLGLVNDVADVDRDRLSGAKGKPVAEGTLPIENANFFSIALLLLVIPLSLQNGITAGVVLLSTLAVGYVHNRWLHGTALSFVGWAATFALLAFFVTLGGWGAYAEGTQPLTTFVVLSAVLGVCVHFLTSLPDLVVDNASGTRHLPLRIALRTGAPRLLLLSGIVTLGTVVLITYSALTVGIAR